MIEQVECTCEAEGCDRTLGNAEFALAFENPAGTRHAYECACGAVTITVVQPGS